MLIRRLRQTNVINKPDTTVNTMKRPVTRLFPLSSLASTLLSLSLFTHLAHGESALADQEELSWYQVELIIYRLKTPLLEEQPELWPRNLQLRYPENWVKLTTTPIENTQEEALQVDNLEQEENPTPELAESSASDTGSDQEPIEEEIPDLSPIPFRLLEEDLFGLQTVKRRMLNSRQYQILFHKSWRQVVGDKKEAPAILIAGGEDYTGQHELSGYIKFHKSRYLHIETDLWLSRFIANTGETQSDEWPLLPTPPSKIEDLELDIVQLEEGATFNLEEPLAPATQDQAKTEAGALQPILGSLEADSTTSTTPFQNTGTSTDNFWSLLDYQELLKSSFIPDQIVTMTQRRRMRSEELHHIDHPLFGLMVKLTPYEVPEISEDEISNNQADNLELGN